MCVRGMRAEDVFNIVFSSLVGNFGPVVTSRCSFRPLPLSTHPLRTKKDIVCTHVLRYIPILPHIFIYFYIVIIYYGAQDQEYVFVFVCVYVQC